MSRPTPAARALYRAAGSSFSSTATQPTLLHPRRVLPPAEISHPWTRAMRPVSQAKARPVLVAAGVADKNLRHAPAPGVGNGASSSRKLRRALAGAPHSARPERTPKLGVATINIMSALFVPRPNERAYFFSCLSAEDKRCKGPPRGLGVTSGGLLQGSGGGFRCRAGNTDPDGQRWQGVYAYAPQVAQSLAGAGSVRVWD